VKEETIMENKVNSLDKKVEQVKKDCKMRRSATHKNLAEMYDKLVEELSEEVGIAEADSLTH
jgi:FMN-dependent NADH-azoreductase